MEKKTEPYFKFKTKFLSFKSKTLYMVQLWPKRREVQFLYFILTKYYDLRLRRNLSALRTNYTGRTFPWRLHDCSTRYAAGTTFLLFTTKRITFISRKSPKFSSRTISMVVRSRILPVHGCYGLNSWVPFMWDDYFNEASKSRKDRCKRLNKYKSGTYFTCLCM